MANTPNIDTLIAMGTAKRGRNHVRSTQALILDSLNVRAVRPERMAGLSSSLVVRSPADTKNLTGLHRANTENENGTENENHVIILTT